MQNEHQIFGIRAIIEAINAGKEIDKVFIQKEAQGELMQELMKTMKKGNINFSYVPVEISLRERRRNPSLNQKGPSGKEIEVQKIIKRNTAAPSSKKGISKKPGGKARIGKQEEKAKAIVRNSKQKAKKR